MLQNAARSIYVQTISQDAESEFVGRRETQSKAGSNITR